MDSDHKEKSEPLDVEARDRTFNTPPILDAAPPKTVRETAPVPGRKLHPLTVVFSFLKSIGGWFLPMILFFLLNKNYLLIGILFFFQFVGLFFETIRYLRFEYALMEDELVTKEGLIHRVERHIPYNRVQDIRIERGLLHRYFGVYSAFIETAGGKGVEATLSVVTEDQIHELRRKALGNRSWNSQGSRLTDPIPPSNEANVLLRLSDRQLLVAGLTSNRAATLLVVLGALWSQIENFIPEETYLNWARKVTPEAPSDWTESKEGYSVGSRILANQLRHWIEDGTMMNWALLTGGIAAVLFLIVSFSIGATFVLFKNYRLELAANDLKRSYGLLTQRNSSIPRHRIQLVKIEEPWIRRIWNLCAVKVDVAGPAMETNIPSQDGRDLLVPLLKKQALPGLLPQIIPGYAPPIVPFQKVSPCMVFRNSFLPSVLLGALCVSVGLLNQSPGWLVWLGLIIPIYLLNKQAYKHLGYLLEKGCFISCRGWLGRQTHIIPYRNIQSISVRQTPFDRRHGVATLQLDSAGQAFTGGAPVVRHVPVEEAMEAARSAAQRASRERFDLK